MDLTAIKIADCGKARNLAVKIKKRADELESEVYRQEKSLKN